MPAAFSRERRSSTSLVATTSPSRVRRETCASITSSLRALPHTSPTARERSRSRPRSSTPRSSRASSACRVPPRHAWATQPDEVTTPSLRRRVASTRAATSRLPRSKAISAPVSSTNAIPQTAPCRRFFPARTRVRSALASSSSVSGPNRFSHDCTAEPNASRRSRSRAASASHADTLWPPSVADALIASPSPRSNDTLNFSTPVHRMLLR